MTNFAAHDGDRNTGPEVLLALPWPPSANRLWRSPNSGPLRGRHLLSPEAREYKANVRIILEALEVEPVPGRVAVDMTAHPPDRRKRDLDNLIKIILDSLKGRAFGDDSAVADLRIRWGEVEPGGIIRVRVHPDMDEPIPGAKGGSSFPSRPHGPGRKPLASAPPGGMVEPSPH